MADENQTPTENQASSLNIFLTNADGVGADLLRLLVAQGHHVAAVTDSVEGAHKIRNAGGLPVYTDLLRAASIGSTLQMQQTDLIINTVTQNINGLPLHNPDWSNYHQLLTEGTAALVSAAGHQGVKRIIHLSYSFLYGSTDSPVDESAHLHAESALAKAALTAEKAVLEGPVPAVILRAGYNYGVYSPNLYALRAALQTGKSLPASAEGPLSWVYTQDLAQAVLLVLEKPVDGEIFNIAEAQPVPIQTFINRFADKFGVQAPSALRLPAFAVQFLRDASTEALLSTTAIISSEKAAQTLGWSPAYAGQDRGIDQILLAWRAQPIVGS